jgi:membrane fusion protein (multidrug efflux system)
MNSLTKVACSAAALAWVLMGCGKGGGGGPPSDLATEVVIARPSVEPVEETISAVGTVEANERVEVKPETSGLIETVRFVEGQRVQQGETLFELDSRKEAASVAQAEAEEKLARANVSRAQTLMGTKAIAQQEVEQLESQVAVKAALQRLVKERLNERRIVASFDGVLGPRLVSPGQYVTAGTPLVTLVDDSQVKVRFRIPERQLAQVQVGQAGRVAVGAYPARAFVGKVDLINPVVDEATRTAEVRLIVPNEENALRPGMFARVELVVGTHAQAIVIPKSALVPALDRFSVYVVESGRAKLHTVKIGVRLPGKAELREGLSAEQEIVVSGTQKLVDGMKVIGGKPLAEAAASP